MSEDPATEPTDAQIVAASVGDPTRFALIFDRHHGVVRGYLERSAGRALAEELASETFLWAFAGRAAYDHEHADATAHHDHTPADCWEAAGRPC